MNRSTTEYTRLFCALLSAAAIGTLAGCKSNRTAAAAAPEEFAAPVEEFEGAPVTEAAMEEITDAEAVAAVGETMEGAGEEPTAMAAAPDGTMMPVIQGFARPDGLGIEDLKLGEGDVATVNSVIVMNYHGTLDDGTVVDSTRGKKAAKYPLSKLVQGWQLGVPGMKVGGIRRLTVPPVMAYGEKGLAAANIPSNATITYSIELLGVQNTAQANVER